MSMVRFDKNDKQYFGGIPFRAVCILLIVTMIIAWSVSGVYARYVNNVSSNNSASVASMGVEIFNLAQYGQAIAGVDYSKVIPGVDIAGPHIQLKINSEVSYALFVQVTVFNCPTYVNIDGEVVKVVDFAMTDDWELTNVEAVDNRTKFTYKYIVDSTDNAKNYVFKAGEEHSYVGSDEIKILQGDAIFVSERYSNVYAESEELSFFIKFESYIQQVL